MADATTNILGKRKADTDSPPDLHEIPVSTPDLSPAPIKKAKISEEGTELGGTSKLQSIMMEYSHRNDRFALQS